MKPQGGTEVGKLQEVSISKKPVELTPFEEQPIQQNQQQPVKQQQQPVKQQVSLTPFDEQEVQETEVQLSPFEDDVEYVHGQPFERKKIVPFVDVKSTLTPDVSVKDHPMPYIISESDIGMGLKIPSVSYAPIYKQTKEARTTLSAGGFLPEMPTEEKRKQEAIKLASEEKRNLDYVSSIEEYLQKGGVPNFELIDENKKKDLLTYSDNVTPSKYKSFVQPTFNPEFNLERSTRDIETSAKAVAGKLKVDYDKLTTTSKEFTSLKKDYDNFVSQIKSKVEKDERFQTFKASEEAFKKANTLISELNNLSSLVENAPSQKKLKSINESVEKENTELAKVKSEYNLLEKKISSGDYTSEDYNNYKKLVSSYNEGVKRLNSLVLQSKPLLDELQIDKNFQKYEESLSKFKELNYENIQTEYETRLKEINDLLNLEYETSKSKLDERLAKAKSDFEAVYPQSYFAKAKEKFGDEAPQVIESVITSDINSKRYDILASNGIVKPIPDYLPEQVKEFVQSSLYLNSTTQEKKYYLNKLFDTYGESVKEISNAEDKREAFFDLLSGTIVPKIDAIFAKSIAKNLLSKAKTLEKNIKSKFETTTQVQTPGLPNEKAKELQKVQQIIRLAENVVNSPYEDESAQLMKVFSFRSLPYIRGVTDLSQNLNIKKIVEFVNPNGKFSKANYDELSEADKLLFDASGLSNSYLAITNPSFKTQLGDIISNSLSFMGEMMLTSGLSKAISQASIKGLSSAGVFASRLSPQLARSFESVSNIASLFVSPEAINNASKISKFVYNINNQAVLSGTQNIANNIVERLTPNNQYFFSADANKYIQDVNEATESNFFSALAKSYFTQLAEVGTESLSDIKIGTAGLGKKFLNRTYNFTEDEFRALSSSSKFSVATLRSIRMMLQESEAHDWMSRLALSDFVDYASKFSGKIKSITNPKNYSPKILKEIMSDAKIGGFGPEFFEELVMDRVTPIIEGQEDLIYDYPVDIFKKEAKEIALGIAPIFIAGGAVSVSSNMISRRVGYDTPEVKDFSEYVRSLSSEDFSKNKQAIYDKANSFARKGSKDFAIKEIEQRELFENNLIEGVTEGLTYQEYVERKKASSSEFNSALSLIKDKDFDSALSIIDNQIVNAPDKESRESFSYLRNKIETNKDNAFREIKKSLNEYERVNERIMSFSLLATGYNPSLLLNDINSLDVTESMKKPLLQAYEALEREYKENLEKFGIKQGDLNIPDYVEFDGFDGNKVKVFKTESGNYEIVDMENEDKDISGLSSTFSSSDAGVIKSQVYALLNSNISQENKTKLKTAAFNELSSRLELLNSFDEMDNPTSFFDTLDYLSSEVDITPEQKKFISSSIRRMFNNSVRNSETPGELSDLQKLLFSLNEYSNIIDLKTISSLNNSISKRIAKSESSSFDDFDVEEDAFTEIPEDTEESVVETISSELESKVKSLKIGKTKSWNKALETSPNKENLKRVDNALNKLVEAGRITEKGKDIITSAIMSSGWLQKFINLNGVIVRTSLTEVSDLMNAKPTRYNPESRKIIIESGAKEKESGAEYIATESQHIREIVEEVIHNANHTMWNFIAGDYSFYQANDELVERMTGEESKSLISNIVKFYKSFNFDFKEFERIKNTPLNERTPDDTKLYSSILDYLAFISKQVGNKEDLMNIDFKDKYTGKRFDTKKLIENYRRYKLLLDKGYTSDQAFYYSKDYREFFARVFADFSIESALNDASKSKIEKAITSARNWFSKNVSLPPLTRLLKSTIDRIDKDNIIYSLTETEKQAILNLQTKVSEFFNEEQEAIFNQVNNKFSEIKPEEFPDNQTYLKYLLSKEDSSELESKMLELYQKVSSRFGDEAFFNFLDMSLRDINVERGKPSITSKGIYDFVIDKSSGDFSGTIGEYLSFEDNTLNSFIRGFNEGKVNKREYLIYNKMMDMYSKDYSPSEIYKELKVYIDKDGAAKLYVMSDFNLRNFGKGKHKLSDVIAYPDLYRIYPYLYNSSIILTDNEKSNSYADLLSGTIVLNKFASENLIQGKESGVETLFHEIQHLIQYKEGFAIGSNIKDQVHALSKADKAFSALSKINIDEFYQGVDNTYTNLAFLLLRRNQFFINNVTNLLNNKDRIKDKIKAGLYKEINPIWDDILKTSYYYLSLGESESRLVANLFSKYNEGVTPEDILAYKDTMPEDEIVEVYGRELGSKRSTVTYKSNIQSAIENSKLITASPQKWLQDIYSRGGNKTEAERYGLDEFLSTKDKFKKEELLDYISGKVIKVKEILLGGEIDKEKAMKFKEYETLRNYLKDFDVTVDVMFSYEENKTGLSFTFERYKDEFLATGKPLYQAKEEDVMYYLFNKREDLNTIDEDLIRSVYKSEQIAQEVISSIKRIKQLYEEVGDLSLYNSQTGELIFDVYREELSNTQWSEYTTFPLINYRELLPVIDTTQTLFEHKHHFAGKKNQLYHNRLNDVTTLDGKKLLLSEEMQSDWTQRTDFGGIDKIIEQQNKALDELEKRIELEGKDAQVSKNYGDETLWERKLEIESDKKEYEKQLKELKSPYQKTSDWVRAAIKRMIKMAVDEGKDGIAWTPAHIQVERWSGEVRDVVGRITFEKYADGSQINVYTDKGHTFEFININGKYVRAVNVSVTIEEIFGKDISNQIIKGEKEGAIESDKIIIGGEGYKDIYDKAAVDIANKIAKKYGLEVGSSEVKTKLAEEDDNSIMPEGSYEKPIKVHSLLFNQELIDDFLSSDELSLYSKRAPVININAFTQLISTTKGRGVSSSELYKVLAQVEININKFSNPQKKNASIFANELVQMWKLQFIKNELPKMSKNKLSEIVKLTKVPVRSKISDYKKDIEFIEKYVKDVNFRTEFERAQDAIKTARSRFNSNFRNNVEFYLAVGKLTKINPNMFSTITELRDFTDTLLQKPSDVIVRNFVRKADRLYNSYISWKDAPVDTTPSTNNPQVDINNRVFTSYLKRSVAPLNTYTDSYAYKLLQIDENELEGSALLQYLNNVEYLITNGKLNHKSYEFIQRYEAQKASEEIISSLDEDFVDMLNSKVVGNPLKEWFSGFIPYFFNNKLGNISKYNMQDFLDYAEGRKNYQGVLNNYILSPIQKNNEKLSSLIESIMTPLVPSSNSLSQGDMVLIGIVGLTQQRPRVKLSKNSALYLNNTLNTDIFKVGMYLDSNSVGDLALGYSEMLKKINESIAKSIAISYGESVDGVSEAEAKDAMRIVAERRGMYETELLKEKELALEKAGGKFSTIYELAKSGYVLDNNQQRWLDEARNVFSNINNGVYTNGLTLEDASVIRNSDEFLSIENYFPILRYNEKEDISDFDAGEQVLYGYTRDFYLNEGFLEKRKNVVMALNVNAWESFGRRVDQQLFYLLNVDHKKFLAKLFGTSAFNGNKDNVSFSKESTNLLKEMLNTIFNRGVSKSQTAIINSKIVKPIKETIDNIKPFYVGALGNSFAQTASTINSMSAMKGSPIMRLKNFASGWTYVNDYFNENSESNLFLKKYAREVYYRGLSDYEIPLVENGNLISSVLRGENARTYSLQPGQSYLSNFVYSVINKDFRRALQLAPLMFFDRIAARVSFFALYNNYLDMKGIPLDFNNPSQEAIEYAIQGMRDTQHTSSEVYQSFISKGIIPGSDNVSQGELAALGDLMLSSIFAFKSFSINETKYLNKKIDDLSRGENVNEAVQAIIYSHIGRMLFYTMKYGGNTLIYTLPLVYAYSGGDWEKFKGRIAASIEGMYNVKNLLVRSLMDNIVVGEMAKPLVSYVVQEVEKSYKGVSKLQDWEKRAYPYEGGTDGGLAFDLFKSAKEMLSNSLKYATSKNAYEASPYIANTAIFLLTALTGSIFTPLSGSDTGKFLKELERQQKMSNTPDLFNFNESDVKNTELTKTE